MAKVQQLTIGSLKLKPYSVNGKGVWTFVQIDDNGDIPFAPVMMTVSCEPQRTKKSGRTEIRISVPVTKTVDGVQVMTNDVARTTLIRDFPVREAASVAQEQLAYIKGLIDDSFIQDAIVRHFPLY